MQLTGLNMRSKHFTTATLKFFYFSHVYYYIKYCLLLYKIYFTTLLKLIYSLRYLLAF